MKCIVKARCIAAISLGIGFVCMNDLPGYAYQDFPDSSISPINQADFAEGILNNLNFSNDSIQKVNLPTSSQIARGGRQVGPRDSLIRLRNSAGYVVKYSFTYMIDQNTGGVMIPMPVGDSGTLSLGFEKGFPLPANAKNAFLTVSVVAVGNPVVINAAPVSPFGQQCFITHGTVLNPSYTKEIATIATSEGPKCPSWQ